MHEFFRPIQRRFDTPTKQSRFVEKLPRFFGSHDHQQHVAGAVWHG